MAERDNSGSVDTIRYTCNRAGADRVSVRIGAHVLAEEAVEAFVCFMLALGYQRSSIESALWDKAAEMADAK